MLRILHACWQDTAANHIHAGARPVETPAASSAITDSDDTFCDLSAEMAAALMLVSSERFSYADAAKVLDLPISTLMDRLYQARKTLGAQLRQSAMSDLNSPAS